MKDKIFIIEDHDEALTIWRKNHVKNIDLVHIDAHLDYGKHLASPIEQVIKEASTFKELKKNLEYSLAFKKHTNDFDKQTNIGNYIYPAIKEGIVKNFYWVIPGGLKEFKKSIKIIKRIADNIGRDVKIDINSGIVKSKLFDSDFIICILDTLPVLKQAFLLDIDTDFLVMDSLLHADPKKLIGKRTPWIYPEYLVKTLKKKIPNRKLITIAYSVNGGYTPIRYKYFGDELVHHFAPDKFRKRFEINLTAANHFNAFLQTQKKEDYQQAINLNNTYRITDNNYGPLYLETKKLPVAKKEFLKILRVDPKNPTCLLGLGKIALAQKNFKKAKEYFVFINRIKPENLFSTTNKQNLLLLAKTELHLKNFKIAKRLLNRYKILNPLDPQSYYLLGCIFEKEKKNNKAIESYKNALNLGLNSTHILKKMLKISYNLKNKDAIIKFIKIKYRLLNRREPHAKRHSST